MRNMWLIVPVTLLLGCLSSVQSEPADGEPSLQIMAKSAVNNAGEKKAVYCQGRNVDQSIEWYDPLGNKVGRRSIKNSRIYVENSKDGSVPLIFQELQIADTGNWTCKAGELEQIIEIIVGEKIILQPGITKINAQSGHTTKMNCTAKGTPTPVVNWYKDRTEIQEKPKKYAITMKDDNYQLLIKNLGYEDSGEYQCKVTQKALSHYTSKTFQLSILHEPFVYNLDTQEVITNKSLYKVNEVYAILNETKNITCSAVANPPPQYQWTKRRHGHETPIREEDTVFTSEDHLYSIMMLRVHNENDLGEYVCTANNSRGILTIIYHVSLGNRPDPPDFVSLNAANASYLEFNVTCSTCNFKLEEGAVQTPDNLLVLGYSFQLVPVRDGYPEADWDNAFTFDIPIEDFSNTLFAVGNITKETTYHSRVRTWNSAGFSDWFSITPNPGTTADATRLLGSLMLTIVITVIIQA